jgi:parvulin-like peptidyl-prolyl isomerase
VSRILKFLSITLLVSMVTAGCGAERDTSAASDNSSAPSQPETDVANPVDLEPALPLNQDGEQIVARVNDQEITLREFERAFDRSRRETDLASYDALAVAVLDTLIEQILINQAAAEMDIVVDEAEIEAELQANRGIVAGDAAWQSWLESNLFTEEEFRESLHDALLTQRVRDVVTRPVGTMVTQVHARHILVSTEEEAHVILSRLNSGENFAALAGDYSRDVTTREQGGDLGWFVRDDLLTPELADVAFGLEPGETAGPVETMLGYHIIETLGFGERQTQPDEQSAIVATQFTDWLRPLLQEATIERYIYHANGR